MEHLLLKKKYEERAKIHKQMVDALKDARDKGTDIPDDKMQEYQKWEKDFDKLSEEIKTLEAAEKKIADISEPVNKPPFQETKTVKETQEERDVKQLKDFEDLLRYGEKGLKSERLAEIRTNQFYISGNTKGGYTVPSLLGDKIADAKKYVGGMVDERVANWFRSSTGATVTFPKVDDTAQKGAVVGEKGDATSGTDMTFSTATLTFYKIMSSIVRVSRELLQDSAFDFAGWLTEMLFKRMFRGLNYYFTLGTGTAMPYGIKAIATEGEGALKASLTRTDLINLAYSVNRAYMKNGMFQFNNNTMKAIRILYLEKTDSYVLWQPARNMGEFDRLEGFPYIVNDDIPDIGYINRSVYFGDFKNFYIGECLPMTVVRLEELYAGTDEIGFNVLGRWASNLVAADYPIKNIRHAST